MPTNPPPLSRFLYVDRELKDAPRKGLVVDIVPKDYLPGGQRLLLVVNDPARFDRAMVEGNLSRELGMGLERGVSKKILKDSGLQYLNPRRIKDKEIRDRWMAEVLLLEEADREKIRAEASATSGHPERG